MYTYMDLKKYTVYIIYKYMDLYLIIYIYKLYTCTITAIMIFTHLCNGDGRFLEPWPFYRQVASMLIRQGNRPRISLKKPGISTN